MENEETLRVWLFKILRPKADPILRKRGFPPEDVWGALENFSAEEFNDLVAKVRDLGREGGGGGRQVVADAERRVAVLDRCMVMCVRV